MGLVTGYESDNDDSDRGGKGKPEMSESKEVAKEARRTRAVGLGGRRNDVK